MSDALEKVRVNSVEYISALAGDPYKSPVRTEAELGLSIREAAKAGARFDDLSDASGYRLEDVHKIVGQ